MMTMLLFLISATVVSRELAVSDPTADSIQSVFYGEEPEEDSPQLKPCSSEYFHKDGKCGGALHGYFRCPKGYWCSRKGFCGTTPAHRPNPRCPREPRDDPDDIKFGVAPNDDDEEQPVEPDDNEDRRSRYMQYPEEFCSSNDYHRWGKCGYRRHGYFRCPQGEWCSASGYCGRKQKYRENAICRREPRPDPVIITYAPTPDDDPYYYGPIDEDTNDGDQLVNDDQDAINLVVENEDLGQMALNGTNSTLESDVQTTVTHSEPSSEQDIDSVAQSNSQADVAPGSTDEHTVELNSRFIMDQGEGPLSENSVGRAEKSRLSNVLWLSLLLISVANL